MQPAPQCECVIAFASGRGVSPSHLRMKAAEVTLLVCVVTLAAFVGLETRDARRVSMRREQPDDAGATQPGVVDSALTPASPGSNPYQRGVVRAREVIGSESALDPAEMRRRLALGARGTYINELLDSRDSSLARWPVHVTDPLRVWVARPASLPRWSDDFVPAVRDAFDTWVDAGIPMRFTFVDDSATADVHVRFLPRFPTGISGKTMWTRSTSWWLVSSDVVLSLTHPNGGAVTPSQMRAIALHEVGHLLGLDHARDPANIMSARIRARDLSDADRATVRLLYSMPAGSARDREP